MDNPLINRLKEKGAAMRQRLSDNWQDFRERMGHKHRLVLMDTDTLQERFSMELTGVNIFTYIGISVIVLLLLASLLIAFTPLHRIVPGYIRPELREEIAANAQVIDSLEVVIAQHEQHIAIIQDALNGRQYVVEKDTASLIADDAPIVYRHSRADSLLRLKVEQELQEAKNSRKKNRR